MFYILLRGKVSVWLPVAHTAMKKPLMAIKEKISKEITILNRRRDGEASELTDLKYRFKALTSKRIATQQADAFFKGATGADASAVPTPSKASEGEEQKEFVTYDDFCEKVADLKWSDGRTKFEWNRLVLDKAM